MFYCRFSITRYQETICFLLAKISYMTMQKSIHTFVFVKTLFLSINSIILLDGVEKFSLKTCLHGAHVSYKNKIDWIEYLDT